MRLFTPLFILSSVVLLSACGGGSSSDKSNSGNPNTDNPGGETPIVTPAIDASNAIGVAEYGISVGESLLQLSQLFLPYVIDNEITDTLVNTQQCAVSGTVDIQLQDNDGTESLTDQDAVSFNFQDCVESITSQAITGTANLAVVSKFTGTIGLDLSLNITLLEDGEALVLESNQIRIESDETDSISTVTMRSLGQNFTIVIDNVTESVTKYDLNYSINKDSQQYRFNMDFDLSSQALDSMLSCQSTQDFEGLLFQLPSVYGFKCSATANNFININRNRSDDLTSVDLFIDDSSQGLEFFNHQDSFEGTLGLPIIDSAALSFSRTVLQVTLEPHLVVDPNVTGDSEVSHVLVSETQQQTFVVSRMFNPLNGSVVQRLANQDFSVEANLFIDIMGNVTRAELSEDGRTLYLFARHQIESDIIDSLYMLDTQTLTIVNELKLKDVLTTEISFIDSIKITRILGNSEQWLLTYENVFSGTEFVLFEGIDKQQEWRIDGDSNASSVLSEFPSTLIVFRAGRTDSGEQQIQLFEFVTDINDEYAETKSVVLDEPNLGFIALTDEYSPVPFTFTKNDVITYAGYVFDRSSLDYKGQLDILKPITSTDFGTLFSQQDTRGNLYNSNLLQLESSNFGYNFPFTPSFWRAHDVAEDYVIYSTGTQLIRVGMLAFD